MLRWLLPWVACAPSSAPRPPDERLGQVTGRGARPACPVVVQLDPSTSPAAVHQLLWLAPSVLLACAPGSRGSTALYEPGPPDVSVYDIVHHPLSAFTKRRGCFRLEERPPPFLRPPLVLGDGPGALPYTIDGRNTAYVLRHLW
ncbi:hypothetical protein [Nannocystis punicea]|uniref:Uncharacterized protein n=1 Tax=Nannocystis punicea TaxID=2995304 RepID=A0ABY7HEG9_9BACT|nr:hypothetical protein [Nannocystis poenicansa]WAS97533.1 hypothetical protein O0S08_15415 [Nannocystis poenicansa]